MDGLSLSGRQRFLDELVTSRREGVVPGRIRCLNWNVRNPSLRRAIKQMKWLEENGFDVIVLTEVKASQGCIYVKDRLLSLGYTVAFAEPEDEDYGVILAVRKIFKEVPNTYVDFLSYRVSFAACNFSEKEVLLIGLYVPVWRNDEKRKFLEAFEKLISDESLKKRFSNWIILGDLNLLEPSHVPHYPVYREWEFFYNAFSKHGFMDAFRFFHPNEKEYSWFGREGNGYRFDHVFVSEAILPFIRNCFYLHEVRLDKLSDHSAMYLEIEAF